MTLRVTAFGLTLIVCLAFAIPTISQTTAPTPETTPATIANVYVQTSQGVDVFAATAAGKLTMVKGSPFADSGQMEGVNGKYLISVGVTNIHTYTIESNRAVGKQASVVNSQDFDGEECGATSYNGASNGAVLDHTGKYFYLQLFGAQYQPGNTTCAAWQTYQVESNGGLTFLNSMEYESFADGSAGDSTVPTISSNDEFAYGQFYWEEYCCTQFSSFTKVPGGALEVNNAFKETDPVGDPSGPYYYFPLLSQADPTGHLAVLMYSEDDLPFGNFGPDQMASYTISTNGSIVSTNTWENMPVPIITNPSTMSMSISGKLVALGGHPGLQLFHFNGADPITPFGGLLLPSVDVDKIAWDNNNHLYVLSYSAERLYVYTVTPTSVSQVAGSPFVVDKAYGSLGMVVVPK
ncbi:MAG: hypothetical protein ABSF53_02745 [Terracidiphilus sp.]|jgi:hypothetical protein